MLADFVAKIAEMATGAQRIETKTIEETDTIVWRCGDKYGEAPIPAPAREATIYSLDSLREYVEPFESAEVFHGPMQIVAYLDGADRRKGCALLALKGTSQLSELSRLPKAFEPNALAKYLRTQFVDVPQEVRNALQRIDFSRKSMGRNSAEHGRETLGRSVEAEVQAADKIPETFSVSVPFFENDGLRGISASVQLGIYLDVTAERVELFVVPGELARALCEVHAEIGRRLAEALPKAKVFNGDQ